MKLVLVLVLLILIPPLISESFSYFDGDLIDYNLEHKNHNFHFQDYNLSCLRQNKKMTQTIVGVSQVKESGQVLISS